MTNLDAVSRVNAALGYEGFAGGGVAHDSWDVGFDDELFLMVRASGIEREHCFGSPS